MMTASAAAFRATVVTTCHLQYCYNLLKQLVAKLWITRFDNQLETSLLTTIKRLVVRYQLVDNKSVAKSQQTSHNLHVFGRVPCVEKAHGLDSLLRDVIFKQISPCIFQEVETLKSENQALLRVVNQVSSLKIK